jgi:hypothetical protein
MADGGMGAPAGGRRNLDGPPWKEAEDATLRALWESTPDAALAGLLPGRTVRAVRDRRGALGLNREPPRRPWTAKEVAVLQYAEGDSYDSLARQLPGRDIPAIHKKMQQAGAEHPPGHVLSIAEVSAGPATTDKQLIRAREAIGQRWARTAATAAPRRAPATAGTR